jgi:hypothetical protein
VQRASHPRVGCASGCNSQHTDLGEASGFTTPPHQLCESTSTFLTNGAGVESVSAMTEEERRPQFREHLHEIREALGGIGKDVEVDVAGAPRLAKEGAKNAIARAAGIRRGPMREWSDSDAPDSK